MGPLREPRSDQGKRLVGGSEGRRIPLWVKVAYTAYVCVLVPAYWGEYGPTNFVWICDAALLMAVPAVWLESPLLASMPAVGIVLPQVVWQVSFLAACAGYPLTDMTDYMFDPGIPLFTRVLSFFHFWLPFFLLWLVWRLGYDRRAFWAQTLVGWALVLAAWLWLPAPPAPPDAPTLPVNVNFVYGLSNQAPQEWAPPAVYVALLLLVLPVGLYLPTHWLLRRLFSRPADGGKVDRAGRG